MRGVAILVVAAACKFQPGATGTGSATIDGSSSDTQLGDAAGDGAPDSTSPPPAFCAPDSHLRLCYSFDQTPLPTTLPDEGAAVVDAQLTNVTQIAGEGGGSAAQLGDTSEIFVEPTIDVTSVHTVEVWIRVDTDPPAAGRSGIIDVGTAPNLDLFWYVNATAPLRQIRCGIGSPDDLFTPELPAAPTSWLYVACVCGNDGTTALYVDGVSVATKAEACTGGAITTEGMTIGQNNNGTAPVDSWLLGAFDGIRLWDEPLSAQTICANSGSSTCS